MTQLIYTKKKEITPYGISVELIALHVLNLGVGYFVLFFPFVYRLLEWAKEFRRIKCFWPLLMLGAWCGSSSSYACVDIAVTFANLCWLSCLDCGWEYLRGMCFGHPSSKCMAKLRCKITENLFVVLTCNILSCITF